MYHPHVRLFTLPPLQQKIWTSLMNKLTNSISSAQHIVVKTNSINAIPDLHLDNSIYLMAEKTPNNSEIPNTEDDNSADISDPQPHQAIFKRPATESTCPSTPPSPTLTSHIPELGVDVLSVKNSNSKNQTTKKVRSRSNSSTRSTEIFDDILEPATAILQNTDSSLTLISFKHILENYSNKNINIHDLCNNVGSKTTEVLDMAEKVKPLMTNRKIKSKIQRLINLLFQSLPHSVELPLQTSNSNKSNQ